MKNNTPFTIYNAAAGSGKTFTLVKEYLKRILVSKKENYYQNLLAITFTNKAVAEMKERIITTLVAFSKTESINNSSEILKQVSEETGLTLQEIHLQSKNILKHLLHHFAGFSVETIDSFNHRLIRTFAKDLQLASNFEVSLDTDQLLAEAVDKLISKAGDNEQITKVLLDFALEKTDDDKSWDISKDIISAAKLLFNENNEKHVEELKKKTLEDFLQFSKVLRKQIKKLDLDIQEKAIYVLNAIDLEGISYDEFMRQTLPNHFLKLKDGSYDVYANKLQENLQDGTGLYKKATNPAIATQIDQITPFLLEHYLAIKKNVFLQKLYNSILKNLTPLSVINLVSKEIKEIKEEKNIIPISEFNSLINKEIKNQPAPFIYERLGEKYKHFFIDEFQDTSLLQWENIIPLIDNALSQQDINDQMGSVLLVGDAKQSIYRWRGGLPEQFMELYGEKNPFSIAEKAIFNLDTNYRSCKEIVAFNNDFFTFSANNFGDTVHQKLYVDGNQQKTNPKEGGYVKFEFIDKQSKKEKDETYPELVYKTILDLKKQNFSEKDICILTRTKKDGITLGNYLMENEIKVISQETLLLQHSNLVQCIAQTITLSIYPENEEVKINLLNILHELLKIKEEKHTFFSKFLNTSETLFSERLKEFEIDFNFNKLHSSSLYESCEYIIKQFKLNDTADAYLFAFMDFVYEFEQQPQADKIAFLDYWETKKDNASIPAIKGAEAVQIMTIHKSKGLEFPVVLFPYADINIYNANKDFIWYPLEDSEFHSFKEAQVNYNAELSEYSETGAILYNNHKNTLELDNLNLLYVTLTRAVEQLYVFSEIPAPIKEGIPKTYNQLFGEFLKSKNLWNDNQLIYEFGNPQRTLIHNVDSIALQIAPIYISSPPNEHNLKIVTTDALHWETTIEKALIAGNLLHDTMASIKNKEDVNNVLEELESRGIVTHLEIEALKKSVSRIVNHTELSKYFKTNATVINERDIITASEMILRPDRLNFNEDSSVSIIDYKTGSPNYDHEEQINGYAKALFEMGYKVSEKILVYINEEDIVINKV